MRRKNLKDILLKEKNIFSEQKNQCLGMSSNLKQKNEEKTPPMEFCPQIDVFLFVSFDNIFRI